ncbi:CRISPR-associated Csn2 family protein [Paucilactobacillus oligofermentans DSM 15707 = LMG 22743]|uniref:CRISPR-associated Csn2 family protein n=1 Tax=Paucilactobacillus oligofermentans DSM 15707 = LMG 22743 TaxID=1423778 RepID=A0A0R1RLG4_9LACO|nr:type II-A CRISPR-associated protein Csn2 [Paucilactobacillus oligofermentans]KRL55514.1 CRISPR-associated Csn2 family protein [Paucilactobacillus oligofermentans DSM 15707 = LMG 22743]CUS25499.1 CRISPR-associated Csn2 family protein [Paucilactobacillus oligofermentans DSM 15707 = LMG 22743]
MKLTYSPFKPFEITKGKITVIETGNYDVYRKMIMNFKDLEDDINFSDDDYKLMETIKALNWIGDQMFADNLNKQFQAKIYKRVFEIMPDSSQQALIELARKIKNTVTDVTYMIDLPLEVNPEIDLLKIIKFAEIEYNSIMTAGPYDIIEVILKTLSELNETKIIGMMNVSDYLRESDFKDLIQLVRTLDLKVLLIKFSEIQRSEKYDECRYYYIDNDFVDYRF